MQTKSSHWSTLCYISFYWFFFSFLFLPVIFVSYNPNLFRMRICIQSFQDLEVWARKWLHFLFYSFVFGNINYNFIMKFGRAEIIRDFKTGDSLCYAFIGEYLFFNFINSRWILKPIIFILDWYKSIIYEADRYLSMYDWCLQSSRLNDSFQLQMMPFKKFQNFNYIIFVIFFRILFGILW